MGQPAEKVDWLERLHALRPWNGVGEFGTEGIERVLRKLGSPQDSYPTIHIAGTNGKGSTAAFITEILHQDGKRVARLTSPHLERVNERIVVGGEPIGDNELAKLVELVLSTAEELGEELSFFETVTACGFLYSREQEVDYAVVEVGLGGRLDATNVISKPERVVITSIGFDHQRLLGESLGEIAREKAGIIKPDSSVFMGLMAEEADEVIREVALERSATISALGEEFTLNHDTSNGETSLRSRWGSCTIQPGLLGHHQVENGAVAAAVCQSLGVGVDAVQRGVSSAKWPGRLEQLERDGRRFILDCAHNIQGIQSLTSFLGDARPEEFVIVTGMLETKSWEEMLGALVPFAKEFKFVEPDSHRALPCDALKKAVDGTEVVTSIHYKEYDALVSELFSERYNGETILVTGSIYLIGKLRGKIVSR